MNDIPLTHQIAEVAREVALRKNVYPGFVARGKMRQGEADEHQRRMQAALDTLIRLRDGEAALDQARAQ